MLTYRRYDHLNVVKYSYSEYVGCVVTRKSIIRFFILLAREEISWKNVKRYVISSFTMKDEFLAYFETNIQTL